MSEALPAAPGVVPPYADLIGTPYRQGGRGPDAFDCYGLISELLQRQGVQMPDYATPEAQAQIAADLLDVEHNPDWVRCQEGPGAIATIRMTGGHVCHVAMVLPARKLIHAWAGSSVCIERMALWDHRITGFFKPNPNKKKSA